MSITDGVANPAPRQPSWSVYQGTGASLRDSRLDELLPPPPPWRRFEGGPVLAAPPEDLEIPRRLGVHIPLSARSAAHEADMVNAALLLRRPLLVTGRPGTGKTSLAYRISRELRLGRVLTWHITSSSTLLDGLYQYDAIARVQETAALRAAAGGADQYGDPIIPPSIGDFVQLGPLGTALLPYSQPRVLLIDELDKSNVDLTNDLLSTFEDGTYSIRELVRARAREPQVQVMTDDPGGVAEIEGGVVTCRSFPVVVMTSNGERDFPPAFLRRCLVLRMPDPDADDLARAIVAHYGSGVLENWGSRLIGAFLDYRAAHAADLAIDQLLNAVHLATSWVDDSERESVDEEMVQIAKALWHRLDGSDP